MAEKEAEILERLADVVPKLDNGEQNYILGVAEGMALVKDMEKELADNREEKRN